MDTNLPEASEGPLARLVWRSPQGVECECSLAAGATIIGRASECQVAVPDTRVSRRHAEISRHGNDFLITDLKSSNGTFVNGERIEGARRLHDGDRIRTGPAEFRFVLLPAREEPAEAQSSPEPTLVVTAPATSPHLEVTGGQQRGVRFDLSGARTVIGRAGRGSRWDVALQDRAVSRPQAEIVRQGDDLVLSDLNSANGTLVNGSAIAGPHSLKEGDALTLGETVLVFHRGAG